MAIFYVDPTELDEYYCSREKVLPTPPSSPTEWPTRSAPVSLSTTTIDVVGLSQASVDEHATLDYWTHISSM
jgi:hypothetical protein